MRLLPSDRPAIRFAFMAGLCACALLIPLPPVGHASQSRSITDGVYSAAQAARGEQLYRTECAACHGDAMEGSSGPPLVGNSFLANWSARPVANVVDKIEKTM